AGGSPMNIARRFFVTLSHQLREFLHQGDRKISGCGGRARDRRQIEKVDLAVTGDCWPRTLRDDIQSRLGRSKCTLKIQHALYAHRIREDAIGHFPSEEWIKHGPQFWVAIRNRRRQSLVDLAG